MKLEYCIMHTCKDCRYKCEEYLEEERKEKNMPKRPMVICSHPGCPELIDAGAGKCDKHKAMDTKRYDKNRGTATERGYTYRWQQYSKWFLKKPENVFCKLQLPGCTNLAKCVDHIDPPDGPDDPRFWDPENHQGSCMHCNGVKGHTKIIGQAEPFSAKRG